jgi:bifunctional enzyme CysN/CysC
VVLAINKMDLVDYDQATFDRIDAEYRAFAAQIGLSDITSIPLSALKGDNMTGAAPPCPGTAARR